LHNAGHQNIYGRDVMDQTLRHAHCPNSSIDVARFVDGSPTGSGNEFSNVFELAARAKDLR
jgi:hypothetical protein